MLREVEFPGSDADSNRSRDERENESARPGQTGPEAAESDAATADPDVWQPLKTHFALFTEYAGYYLSLHADRLKLHVRTGVLYGVLALVALLAGMATVVMAIVVLVNGMTHGLSIAFGGRLWAAELTTGMVLLSVIAAGAFAGVRWLAGTSLAKVLEKYENRRQKQRGRFGRDVRKDAGRPVSF